MTRKNSGTDDDLNERACRLLAELKMWRHRIVRDVADAILDVTGEVTSSDVAGQWGRHPLLWPGRPTAVRLARGVLMERSLRGELVHEYRDRDGSRQLIWTRASASTARERT